MDTITIDRLERDGQTLIVAPPFVFAVQETTVNGEPAWEACVRDESPLPLPAPRSLLPPGSLRSWCKRQFRSVTKAGLRCYR